MSEHRNDDRDREYGRRMVQQAELETWPNPAPARPYVVRMESPEFTCLCPRSGFPDFATIRITYQPRELIVELKSLKLYLNKFRDVAVSHEDAVNRILDDLVEQLHPHWMRVTGDFNVRGNIKTVVVAEHGRRVSTDSGDELVGRPDGRQADGGGRRER